MNLNVNVKILYNMKKCAMNGMKRKVVMFKITSFSLWLNLCFMIFVNDNVLRVSRWLFLACQDSSFIRGVPQLVTN